MRPGLLLGVNNDPPSSHTNGATAYPKSMPAQQFTPTRVGYGSGYDYGYTTPPPVVPAPAALNGNHMSGNSPTWSLPNSCMRSHGRSLSSFSGSLSAQSEDGDIEIDDVNDEDEGYERGGGRGRVLMRNGRTEMGMGVDDMDNDEEEDEDEDDGHNDNEDLEEDEEDEGTRNEIYARYSSRYRAHARMDMTMGDQHQQMKSTKWDGVGDMDIEMDMDMDMD